MDTPKYLSIPTYFSSLDSADSGEYLHLYFYVVLLS